MNYGERRSSASELLGFRRLQGPCASVFLDLNKLECRQPAKHAPHGLMEGEDATAPERSGSSTTDAHLPFKRQ